MGFPIVQGTPTISTRSLANPEPVEEYAASDRSNLVPGEPLGPFPIFACTPDLHAIVTVSFYEMIREKDGETECWTTDLRVQIVPSCDGFSSVYRDSLYRIELPHSSSKREFTDACQHDVTPTAVFSKDHRFLVCLIPHPQKATQSSVIVFQLRKPKPIKSVSSCPPLPSYLSPPPESSINVVPVATNPTFLKSDLMDVSAMCPCESRLVLGCRSGRLLLASYRPLHLIGQEDPFRSVPIVSISGWRDSRLAVVYGDGIVSCFKLAPSVFRSGSDRSLRDERKDNKLSQRSFSIRSVPVSKVQLSAFLRRTHYSLESLSSRVCWVGESFLALLDLSNTALYVRTLKEKGESGCVQTLSLEPREVRENAHVIDRPVFEPSRCWFQASHVAISLDPWTHSTLALSFATSSNKGGPISANIFWNWRANTQGFSSVCEGSLLPFFEFARHHQEGRKITRICQRRFGSIQKDVLDVALLSPPNSMCVSQIRPPSALLLASRVVAYPSPRRKSVLDNFDLQWNQSAIPKPYIHNFGTPSMALFASRHGRSVAVAASRGVCVLECFGILPKGSLARKLHSGRTYPKWHMFHNESDERSFRVISMVWWEQVAASGRTEDLLIAVIERIDDGHYFLCCWPSRDLGKHSQLLRSTEAEEPDIGWGIELPSSYIPGTIDILPCPSRSSTFRPEPKACLLLSAPDKMGSFLVFQLQAVSTGASILVREASAGNIGDESDLFLASANFDFDLRRKRTRDEVSFIATVGALRSIGVDALGLSSTTVVAVGQLFGFDTDVPVGDYWMSDVVQRRGSADETLEFLSWTFHLTDGKIGTWSVPVLNSSADAIDSFSYDLSKHHTVQSVHPKGMVLGMFGWTGSSSLWMQKASKGARRDYLVGSVPMSHCGYVIGVSQTGRSLKTSIDSRTEEHVDIFDCSRILLYPPSQVSSLFSLALESASAGQPCALERHILSSKRAPGPIDHPVVLCLQLLILRAVELVSRSESPNDQTGAIDLLLLQTTLRALKKSVTPLQFISTVLKVGRQLEPGTMTKFFPLPLGSDAVVSPQSLFIGSLSLGSLKVALSAIPILQEETKTREFCTFIFRHCLNLMDITGANSNASLVSYTEEFAVVTDVFRYAMTIADRSEEADTEASGDIHQRRYSLFCSAPRGYRGIGSDRGFADSLLLLSPTRSNEKIPRGIKTQTLRPWSEMGDEHFPTVTATVSRFIVSTIFCVDTGLTSWSKVGCVANHLMEGEVCLKCCTHKEFGALLADLPQVRFSSLVSSIGEFLRKNISICLELDGGKINALFELCLVLLGSPFHDIKPEIGGLMLVTIVSGHCSGNLHRVVDYGHQSSSQLWSTFLEVAAEL